MITSTLPTCSGRQHRVLRMSGCASTQTWPILLSRRMSYGSSEKKRKDTKKRGRPSLPPSEKPTTLVAGREVRLRSSAERAYPILGKVFKGCSGFDSVVGITYSRVVHIPAKIALILFHGRFLLLFSIAIFVMWGKENIIGTRPGFCSASCKTSYGRTQDQVFPQNHHTV
ncbi:hypothetical protein SDC9_110028 [bioreactor metagenome]|jgi:hypothetical protein|uniref:Uncharacterized protein n=1 Tax=bioreactor metagenome TaxID=1076179 RepID=A0A645BDL7_9ZZZZ